MRKIKNVLVLAGGDSTRFWPLEDKNLFYFLGKPLILHHLEKISKYTENIIIVANQKNSLTIKRIIDNLEKKNNYQVVIQKNELGQGGAILSVKNFIKGETLIINASDLYDFSIIEKIFQTPYEKEMMIFFGKKILEYFPGGYFKFNQEGEILKIIEKPGKENMPSNILKLVIDYFSDIDFLIKELEKVSSKNDDIYEQALNNLLKTKIKRKYFLYQGYFEALKYPWHVLSMMKYFLSTIKKSYISKTAVISDKSFIIGPVFIDDEVRIGDFVKIVGPCYIGENTVISDYSLIRESHIGKDCLIGSYSEIARSYIGNKVFLHRNYVGDSVLDDEMMMGAQALTANLRFDGETVSSYVNDKKIDTSLSKFGTIIGKEAKIGVNAIIFPGVKIGKKTWVAPGEKVSFDIKDFSYFADREEKENLKI